MFERTFAFLGYQFARLQFSSDIDTPQPMTDFFRGAQNVLIAMPIGYQEAACAGDALRKFRDRLTHLNLTVIHTSTRATSLIDFPKCEVIRMDPADLNKFSLPTTSILRRIFTRPYDVAVDFNLDFVLYTAYICKASHAKVRVGFAHAASDLFFNVQLNLNKQRTPKAIYEAFASCLAMF